MIYLNIEEKQDYGVSSLLLTKDGFIYLPEFKKTLNMETMQRALYLFLLKKVEGNILLTNKNMMDYTYEISRIYHALKHSYIVYSKDTPDYDDYLKERGTYFELDDELPNKSCRTEDELIKRICSLDYEQESRNTEQFRKKFIEFGGNASEQAVKALFSELEKGEMSARKEGWISLDDIIKRLDL